MPGIKQLLDLGNSRLNGLIELIDSVDGEVVHDLACTEDQPADRSEEQVVPRHEAVPTPVDQRDHQHRQGLGEFLGYADGDDALAQGRVAAMQRGLQRDRQRHLRRQRDRRHHDEHCPGHVFRSDDDAEQQQPGNREVDGEYPGHVVERAGARVPAQDDQGDRRDADQHEEQHHRPAAERVVPDPVAKRQQVVHLPGASLLGRRDRRVSGHRRVISPAL